jgi:hypothetical protein
VLDDLLEGTAGHERMSREFRAFLLLTADKFSTRCDEELFRRYANSLVQSPRQLFRVRDADGLVRFVLAAALASCDLDNVWFTEDEFEILAEMGVTLYDSDAVAFYEHRAEGETHSTFAYMPVELCINWSVRYFGPWTRRGRRQIDRTTRPSSTSRASSAGPSTC